MTKEFKKVTNQNETRYILEMTSGGTGSAAVSANGASPTSSIGEIQRRIKELKEKVDTIKVNVPPPRTGHKRTQTGAGPMRDKTKTIPRKEKHKKPYFEDSDGGPDDSSHSIFRDKPDVRPWPGNVTDTELSNVDPQDHDEMEGSFVKNQIHTMLRVLKHLDHAIGDEEDLPEWVQMKLSQAQQTVVSVMNFMISDKELDVEKQTDNDVLMKEQGVEEGLNEFAPDGVNGGNNGQPRFIRQDNEPSNDGKYMVQVWDDTESYSVAVAFVQRKGPQQYIMYPIDDPELHGEGGLLDRAQEYVDEIEENAIQGSKEDFIANKYMPLESVLSKILDEQGVEEGELNEDEYDYLRDLRAGLISKDEYNKLVQQFQNQTSSQTRPVEVKRHYFIVPFADKDKAKNYGMKFDPDRKQWYKPQYNTSGRTFNWQLQQIQQMFKPVVEQSVAESKKRCPQCGMPNCTCAPGKCGCKPIAGWVPNKGFKKATDEQSVEEEKIKGVDGKACWKGKRYAGKVKKADGTYKDKCVPVGEDTYINQLMSALESKK